MSKMDPRTVSLDDRWEIDRGRIVLTGAQAIARALLAQRQIDTRNGIASAGYITGYRGSPLGNVDTTLWSVADRLRDAGIRFQPGLNEDIAATALHGTQQIDAVPGARHDGVFAAWYGKGPGVDRSGDTFKHGNYAGAHRNGGVLLYYGDDHAGKSSTVAHQSEQAIAANLIPSLYPADVEELFRFSLLAIAMSRYAGCWVAIKCVGEIAEQTATVDIDIPGFDVVRPAIVGRGAEPANIGEHLFNPLGDERVAFEHRLPRAQAFVAANRLDRIAIDASQRRLGIVTSGKSYGDVRAALALLGLDETRAAASGISLYKLGCIWPVEEIGLRAFARDQSTLLCVEEKKSFVEQQAAAILINVAHRPALVGKRDETGEPLLSSTQPLTPVEIAQVIVGRLRHLGLADDTIQERLTSLPCTAPPAPSLFKRGPYFCSGCPHNRSTRIPDGSISMTGIGCHTMANFVRPEEALLPTQMGGEGANWIGLAPFTDTPHIFQNMGDGTYYHSGLLAIRGAVAAGVNITYKILFNDAVAMTGGQPVDGPISVAAIAHQLRHEGVGAIVVLSDDPARHRMSDFPAGTRIGHRDTLDGVQRELREMKGCTILIYEQTCAAEKRRRRKRGEYPDPPRRLFIASEVCEGCGDCSEQSTCVSLTPVDTAFGTKRAIDQSSCNKDYSCLDGFCPSFITIDGAEPRKPEVTPVETALFDDLPEPTRASIEGSYDVMVAGIGGTGVVTVGALLGMAAHIDGLTMSLYDMTGLSQKNGAVYSHVRFATGPGGVHGQRIGAGQAHLLLAFDQVAALAPEAADTIRAGRTRILANTDVVPTAALQFDRDFHIDSAALLARLARAAGQDATRAIDATGIARDMLGDSIGANLFLVGAAAQSGLLPVSVAAIEQAIRLNAVAVNPNLTAFRFGRLFIAAPDKLAAARVPRDPRTPMPATLAEIVAHRRAHLIAYQGEPLAERFAERVRQVHEAERAVSGDSDTLAITVARNYARLLAYKDEYEVARLLTQPALHAELKQRFADGARIALNLAPPILPGLDARGRPHKRAFGRWIFPLLGLLARCRGLRGTPFDPFGYHRERRQERALIVAYEALIDHVLARLDIDNLPKAVALLDRADAIRGYGPVKTAAIESYRQSIIAAEVAFDSGEPAREPIAA